MSVSRTSLAGIGIGLVILYAAGSGIWVSAADQWYRSLNALSTIPLLVIAYKASVPIFLALIPYQLWIITASFLSWGYSQRN